MVFSSETFLFLFLPAFLAIYYLTPNRWRSVTILLGSYVFYGWWRIDFLALLFATTLWTYVFGLLVARTEGKQSKMLCIAGTVGCLSVLGFFKYFNFVASTVGSVLGQDPAASTLWHVILPIGVSFYVFESISYLVDVYRRESLPARNFADFASFVSLFPHLVAGPILRFRDLRDQFANRTHSLALFSQGMTIFIIGLAKKVLIADTVAPLADTIFSQAAPTLIESWLGAGAYTIQLYFDFSGYSDMAIGLGLMMGFRLMENFNAPYTSKSITEFWRRWHISLSVWLRDYLYIPLGGNRKGVARTYFNLFIVMVLGGLWHGANWTFVIWGTWHGAILAIERYFAWPKKSATVPWSLLLTLLFIVLGWVMFRAPNVGAAMTMYGGMVGLNGLGVTADVAWQLPREGLVVLAIAIGLTALEPRLKKLAEPELVIEGQGTAALRAQWLPAIAMSCLTVLVLMRLADQAFSPFLYFQF
ncbi:alginate O-acetyltransferase complex protein AlgI [Devosia sp. UYZn731]|uniref:MBOAT family O-acyltransferase n=1 Tax=Devosia sp. UYZn731 TaxID=3156345 RepID=UPI003396B63D